ncbi:hypothetical protein DPMN_131759, partial [Dreissena polymorpha]
MRAGWLAGWRAGGLAGGRNKLNLLCQMLDFTHSMQHSAQQHSALLSFVLNNEAILDLKSLTGTETLAINVVYTMPFHCVSSTDPTKMAALMTAAIVSPTHYDPSFKVDVQLHEPLLSRAVTPQDVRIEMISLCFQFETLCKKELAE